MPSMATRYDRHGPIKLMVEHSGYLMVRRPHCGPFVLKVDEWEKLAEEAGNADKIETTNGHVIVYDY